MGGGAEAAAPPALLFRRPLRLKASGVEPLLSRPGNRLPPALDQPLGFFGPVQTSARHSSTKGSGRGPRCRCGGAAGATLVTGPRPFSFVCLTELSSLPEFIRLHRFCPAVMDQSEPGAVPCVV